MQRSFRDRRLYARGESRFIWARVRDEHGHIKPVSTRCTDEKAATLFADEWERRAADPSYKRASETTLDGAIVDYLTQQQRKAVSEATMSIARTKLGHFVRLWGGSWPLSRVDNDLMLKFIDTREGEGVKPYTVKKELSAMRRCLEWATFRGTFQRPLATVFPPHYSGKHKPKTRAPLPEEVMRLLAHLTPKRAAHVAFLVATGARLGESFRACREDVDLDKRLVRLRGTKTEKAAGVVPITPLTWDLIVYALHHAPGSSPLFEHWGEGNYWRDLQAACRRAEIAPLSPNDLRRAFGKWHRQALLRSGGSKESAAELTSVLLRHSTDKLAQTTYATVTGEDIAPALQDLAPVRILTAGTAGTASTGHNRRTFSEGNERACSDSNGGHSASKTTCQVMPESPRSVGNSQAHARRVGPHKSRAVRVLTAAHKKRGVA